MTLAETILHASQVFEKVFSYTVIFHFPRLDKLIQPLCDMVGFREDYARMLITLVISYPMAYFQTLIRNKTWRKVISLVQGIAILQFCFSFRWIHCFLSSLGVYLLMRFASPKYQPYFVFFFTLFYLSGMSLYTMYTDYMSYALDATTYEMVIVAKLQMLAWSYYDGTYDRKNVDEGAKKDDRSARMYKRRQEEYVTELPSLFDFFSFVFHFAGIMGGPAIYYREYSEVIAGDRFKDGFPSSRYMPALKKMLIGVFGFVVYLAVSGVYSVDDMLSPEFRDHPLIIRLILIYLLMLGYRGRYYGIWKIGESICNLNGFGLLQKEGKDDWSGVSNVDIVEFELAWNYSLTAKLWNKRIQQWLQMCIYERTNFNQVLTFMVSAFWHGFYPSYYVGFGLASFTTHVDRLSRKKILPRVKGTPYEKLYITVMTVICAYSDTFMLSAFGCYSLKRALLMWRQCDFFHPLLLLILCVVLTFIPSPRKEKKE